MQHRSYLTQVLLNYFDEKDVRVREGPATLDAQLLNGFAGSMEDLLSTLQREFDGRKLSTVPLNIDHEGIYYRVQIPASEPIGDEGPSLVQATFGSGWKTLAKYDDTLPIPVSAELDSNRQVVPLSSPILNTVSGSGVFSSPFALSIPNKLWCSVSGLVDFSMPVTVQLEGHTYPLPADQQNAISGETLIVRANGMLRTSRIWSDITSISVFGAGPDVQFSFLMFPAGIDIDAARPYSHPHYREVSFDRYFRIDSGLLQEVYHRNSFADWDRIQSYLLEPDSISSLAVEPNTNGMYLANDSTLFYIDRREPMPSRLDQTAISADPLYTLQVSYDYMRPGSSRSVVLKPIPGRSSAKMTAYRLTVQLPDGTFKIIIPEGGLADYTSDGGWRRVMTSQPVIFPLIFGTGNYVFTLECTDSSGAYTRDPVPYENFGLTRLASLDVSTLVPQVAGLCFDAFQRLWLWTGLHLVPVRFRYDAYVWDTASRSVYLTDRFSKVRIS